MTGPSTTRRERLTSFRVLCASLLLLMTGAAFSQSDSSHSKADSSVLFRPTLADTLPHGLTSAAAAPAYQQHKSPWLAVGMSAILPGSGQIYNADYWKAPVIWGLSAYWIYEWKKLNDLYRQYGDLYNQSLAEAPASGDARYKEIRDFYRDERDKFAWYMGALYMVNLVDAYVGAHLYDFDVSPNLGLGPRMEPVYAATIRYRF